VYNPLLSEEYLTSIFSVQEYAAQETGSKTGRKQRALQMKKLCLSLAFTPVSSSAHSSTMQMTANVPLNCQSTLNLSMGLE
jgi:hypothetical protein